MKTFKEELPDKHKLFQFHLPDGQQVIARGFEGGSGVYSVETEDFDDKRYWCEGDDTPGCNLEDIYELKWEYITWDSVLSTKS